MAGAAAVAACDAEPRSGRGPGRPGHTSGADRPADPGSDLDAGLVSAVTAELDELLALVTAAAAGHPSLASDLSAFAALHRAHRAVLPGPRTERSLPRVSGTTREVAADLVRREDRARRRLADWAVGAESGALARLLASMAAGIAAHLAGAELAGSRS